MDKLNLGCGGDVREGFVNVDVRREPGVEAVCDAAHLPFSDGVFGEVVASDLLEHFSWRRTGEVLQEWRRVLRSGGELVVKVPNMHTLIQMYGKGRIPFQEFIRIAYGNQDYAENTHRAGFNPELIRYLLEENGFEVVEVRESLPGGDWKNIEVSAEA